jgi:glycosyltransferase involved in cell wall biosynthesis
MSHQNKATPQDKISVVIPTFRRSEGLQAALESVFLQTIMDHTLHVLVADNNPTPYEKQTVERLSAKFNHPIDYVHEPEPGVSNIRNAAMRVVKNSRYIAFLDDDMCASPQWLEALLETSRYYKAGLVFGPTHAVMPNKDDRANLYMKPFFDRIIDREEDGLIQETLGTGGCLLDVTYCEISETPFNPDLNERGGEDDIFFDHLRLTGTKVAWSSKAVSFEIVPPSRATPYYIWKRNFGYGQGPSRIQANRGWKGIPGVLYYMATGTLQLLIFAPNLIFRRLLNHPSQTKFLALTARAFGKIFWNDRFSPLLYGKAMA